MRVTTLAVKIRLRIINYGEKSLPSWRWLLILENMKEQILDFITRRFQGDCNWLCGNCYYFATILLSRFPNGSIYYDVINGHFVFKYEKYYYDWTGCVEPDGYLIKWDKFDEYDPLQKERIIKDCII